MERERIAFVARIFENRMRSAFDSMPHGLSEDEAILFVELLFTARRALAETEAYKTLPPIHELDATP